MLLHAHFGGFGQFLGNSWAILKTGFAQKIGIHAFVFGVFPIWAIWAIFFPT